MTFCRLQSSQGLQIQRYWFDQSSNSVSVQYLIYFFLKTAQGQNVKQDINPEFVAQLLQLWQTSS